jgi:hypothetical protein
MVVVVVFFTGVVGWIGDGMTIQSSIGQKAATVQRSNLSVPRPTTTTTTTTTATAKLVPVLFCFDPRIFGDSTRYSELYRLDR